MEPQAQSQASKNSSSKSQSMKRVEEAGPQMGTGWVAANEATQSQHRSVSRMILEEQASQTLKFHPSKEAMTVTNPRAQGGAPPLPTISNGRRPLNSERGALRDNEHQLLPHQSHPLINEHVFYNTGTQMHLSSTDQNTQHYQSTNIEQNVMMFDQSGQQPNLEMSSAFDHIQDELTKLNDQLMMPVDCQTSHPVVSKTKTTGAPRSTKTLTKKSNARLLSATAAHSSGRTNTRQSRSRSASRSRQVQIMNRLAQGGHSTTITTAQTSARQHQTQPQNAAKAATRGGKIRTHARLHSVGLQQPTKTQESHRSLRPCSTKQSTVRRKQSLSSNHTRARSRPRAAAYDTIQNHKQEDEIQAATDERQTQRLGKPRSQRSFSNLPLRRLSRARSKSSKALGQKQGSRVGQADGLTGSDQVNLTQQPTQATRPQFYAQKTQQEHQRGNQTYVYTGADTSSMILMPGGLNSADQTIMAQASNQNNNQTAQDGQLVNILTAGVHKQKQGAPPSYSSEEPPQYLIAHDNSQDLDSYMPSNAPHSDANNGNSSVPMSQIEQIMARYEQLCKKLDSSQQMPQDHLVVNEAGQIVFREEQPGTNRQQNLLQQQNHFAHPLQQQERSQEEESLDMYIAQHEESMMQESVNTASNARSQPHHQHLAHEGQLVGDDCERQQTMESPARHIGPREYIEILSGKQEQRCHQESRFQQTHPRQQSTVGNHNHLLPANVNENSLLQPMESEIGLAENQMGVTASQFNQLSSLVEDNKEGTSTFQGIALTTSELNTYQDSQTVPQQQKSSQRNKKFVSEYQDDDYEQNKENDDQLINVSKTVSLAHESHLNNENLQSQNAPNTQQTSKHCYTNQQTQQLRSAAMSGQQTHGQASVTSYNTADFTKLSINQQDVLSNQLRSSKAGPCQAQTQQQTNEAARKHQTSGHSIDMNTNTNSVAMAMTKLQDRAEMLEDGLKSAMQIILQLGQQLNDLQGGVLGTPVENGHPEMEQVEELDTIESVVDLLAFMKNDKRNLLVRNPQIQQVVQNSLQLFKPPLGRPHRHAGAHTFEHNSLEESVSAGQQQQSYSEYHQAQQQHSHQQPRQEYQSSNSKFDAKAAAQKQMLLTMFSTSMVGGGTEHDATSPPAQHRCATEMSALIGSPVGVLDLSAINQFSQQTTSNVKTLQQTANAANRSTTNNMNNFYPQNQVNCFTNQQIVAQQNSEGREAPSMDTVKLVGVAAYNQVKPFDSQVPASEQTKPLGGGMRPTHDRVNSQQHVAQVVQQDGQLLTLRNQKIFEADESNIFSQTMSPNHDQSRRQNNMVTHLFSQEEESSISHQKTTDRQQTQQLNSCQENATNTGRGGTSNANAAELSFDSVFSKEPLARRQQQQQQNPQTQAATGAGQAAFQGYSPVILNRVSEISSKQAEQRQSAAQYNTANFVGVSRPADDVESSSVVTSSARSSVFNAANQSLSQQELSDIMFASVRNPAKFGYARAQHDESSANDDGSNVGILTALAQKRRQGNVGGGQYLQHPGQDAKWNQNGDNGHPSHQQQQAKMPERSNPQKQAQMAGAAAPWKSLNLSKLHATDQNSRQVQAVVKPVASNAVAGASGAHAFQTNAGSRRHKGYNNEEDDQDLEEASRILTLDDFSPNFISQKPEAVHEKSAAATLDEENRGTLNMPQIVANQQQTLVSFRRMTNRAPETMQSQASSHADRVAAALVMSSGPTTEDVNDSDYQRSSTLVTQQPGVVAASSHHDMASLENARNKFLGGFTSLKSEISQLKQTIMNKE